MSSTEKPAPDAGGPASPAPPPSDAGATGKTPPKNEPDEFALLLQTLGDIPAGRIVRGPASEIRALASGVARPATPRELGIAGGKSIRLPKKR